MQKNILKYSAVVFVGGASYGVMASSIKTAFAEGFTWPQVVASQPFFATLLFGLALLALRISGKKPCRLATKEVLGLLGLGLSTCTTCVLYNFALTMLPVAIAITLLFQFTWIGLIIQLIATRRMPHTTEVAAALVIFVGTLCASGLFSEDLRGYNPLGLVCALLSALSSACFMFLSSRVGTKVPPIERGFFVCLGSCILGFLVCPDYFVGGALQHGIAKHGLILGTFGFLIPVVMFGIGAPHLPTGLSTIMASAELPCGIAISVLILGEAIDTVQIIGVIVILSGVIVSQIPQARPHHASPS